LRWLDGEVILCSEVGGAFEALALAADPPSHSFRGAGMVCGLNISLINISANEYSKCPLFPNLSSNYYEESYR
jgi:hypothetical protein